MATLVAIASAVVWFRTGRGAFLPLGPILGAGIGCAIGPATGAADGIRVGRAVGSWLYPKLSVFPQLWDYLAARSTALLASLLGYALLILWFAATYQVAWSLSPRPAFQGLPDNPRFVDFLYLSVITIATVGYGDITPRSPLLGC